MSENSFDGLPYPLDEIATITDLHCALHIAENYGGIRISIPPYAKEDHWLTETVGMDNAKKICDYFRTLSPEGKVKGTGNFIIPRGPAALMEKAKVTYNKARDAGLSVRMSARKGGVHESTGFRWEKERKNLIAANDNDQAKLPL